MKVNVASHLDSQWKLLEFVETSSDTTDGPGLPPLQLCLWRNSQSDAQDLWIISGHESSQKVDTHVVSLMQKAIQKSVIRPVSNIYLTPIANPYELPLSNIVGTRENKVLLSWADRIKPKAILFLKSGSQNKIEISSDIGDIAKRMGQMTEQSVTAFVPSSDNSLGDLAAWIVANNVPVVSFTIENAKRSFEEIKDNEWKLVFGPAIKWLVEGNRFDPPKEEPAIQVPDIIPVLDIPPELVNL